MVRRSAIRMLGTLCFALWAVFLVTAHPIPVERAGGASSPLAGIPEGPAVVNVSDPAHPRLVDEIAVGEGSWDWTTVDICAAHGRLILGSPAGLQLFDIADPAHPRPTASLDIGTVQRILVDGSLVYAARRSDLVRVDISDPTAPRVRGTTPVAVAGMAVAGDSLYVAAAERGLLRLRSARTIR